MFIEKLFGFSSNHTTLEQRQRTPIAGLGIDDAERELSFGPEDVSIDTSRHRSLKISTNSSRELHRPRS